MQIGNYTLTNKVILAPMAGITDLPFRKLCYRHGAALTVSEMVASNPDLVGHTSTLSKADFKDIPGIRSVQILGNNPLHMAEAAYINVQRGAQIIDINMGCPAKKVCTQAAGSALMKDEDLVKRILDKVVNAVSVPVTLKIRTGWDVQNKNAPVIAKIAEDAGIAALTVHGRTRACKFNGEAEYATIRHIKESSSIPIIANGDIDSPEKAQFVLRATDADAVMIGRAAQGNPWIFGQINEYLRSGILLERPNLNEIHFTLMLHLEQLYLFYGKDRGVKIARKHIDWYFKNLGAHSVIQKNLIYQAEYPAQQVAAVNNAFTHLNNDLAA